MRNESLLAVHYPERFPAAVDVWDEIAPYKASWIRIGVAKTTRGLAVLLGKALRRRAVWGANPPRLTTGGPVMGTIRVKPLIAEENA